MLIFPKLSKIYFIFISMRPLYFAFISLITVQQKSLSALHFRQFRRCWLLPSPKYSFRYFFCNKPSAHFNFTLLFDISSLCFHTLKIFFRHYFAVLIMYFQFCYYRTSHLRRLISFSLRPRQPHARLFNRRARLLNSGHLFSRYNMVYECPSANINPVLFTWSALAIVFFHHVSTLSFSILRFWQKQTIIHK